ncbi:hypothetical protein [Polyangium sp. y55x31]|uniref:hypothetical protein n=1 Tax=Polyangium sp. y55x31 TaxID=3042688 RepID=UPI002482AC98|nr:hypothetical protein [Polyangium sp. y55x31]MDI1480049.1 hypothetical protein [Polyangium sp. y55x31]
MGAIDYKRFYRILTRCQELGTDAGARPVVGRVYADVLKGSAEAFLTAHKSVLAGESAAGKEGAEANAALVSIDQPYREARAVALAYVPTLAVPDTLKRQPTDTDKVNALEELLDAIDDHVGTPWADEIVNGEFGQRAPMVIKEIRESVEANTALANAKHARATAYGPAYEKYLSFKRVVREVHGPSSKEYKRIHLRAASGGDESAEDGAEG